uniref:Uncharacterized protein n=1 Tax=Staphylothermus marinus TaxID=2280 RepID=A0A7C4H8W0_STAMA
MKLRKIEVKGFLKDDLEYLKRECYHLPIIKCIDTLYLYAQANIINDEISSKEEEGIAVYEDEDYYCRFLKKPWGWEYECYEKIRE